MAAGHGGARPNSGPKPKGDRPTTDVQARYDDPLAYLIAVATGETPGDSLRVAAAKAALPWTTPKKRAPPASPSPQKLQAATQRAEARASEADFASRAAEIRRKHALKGKA
jgi:hypothetical protein